MPDKYFVITNNEIVRVRYLIAYGSEMKNSRVANLAHTATDNTILNWIRRHKWSTAMVSYAAVLLLIGASNSRQGYYMWQYVRQASFEAIEYMKSIGFNCFRKWFG